MEICWKKEGKWFIASGIILLMAGIGLFIKDMSVDDTEKWIIIGIVSHNKIYLIPGILVPLLAIPIGTGLGILSSRIIGRNLWTQMANFLSICMTDVLESLPKYPTILLTILIIPQYYRHKLLWVMIILGMLNSAKISRIIKAKIDLLEKREYIEAAKSFGVSTPRLVCIHILKCNCLSVFISQYFFSMIDVILIEIGLAYISSLTKWGMSSISTFGNMLVMAKNSINSTLWILPLLLVVFNILTLFNLSRIIEKRFARRQEDNVDF